MGISWRRQLLRFFNFSSRSFVSMREPGIRARRGRVSSVSSLSNKKVVDVNVATIGLPAKVLLLLLIGLWVFGRK